MSFRLSRKERFIMAIIFLFLAAGLVNYYLFILQPVQSKAEQFETELNQEEALLSTVEASVHNKQEKAFQGTMELQKKLPVEPLLEQFLLDLEKAEIVSGSFITSMSFGKKGNEDSTNLVEQYIEGVEEAIDSQNDASSEETDASQESTAKGLIPEGIKRLTVNLTVEAPSYFELEAFLRAIEETRRISKIDELRFSGNEEAVSTDSEPETLIYTLTVSTFYYPKLEELKDQLPSLEVPNPSQKINPLVPLVPGSKNVNEEEEANQEDTEENEENNNETAEIIEHKVQPGETLYRISQKYYNDRSGEDLIKEYNELEGNTVYTGQVLKIPIEK
jgi:type IV pilus assembly protein PilO